MYIFKHKTAYVMRISYWSSDVCSSDLCTPRIVLRSWFASRFAAFSALAGPVLANPVLASPVLAGPALARRRRDIAVLRRTPALVLGDREIGRVSCRESVSKYV